jgi:hypothetical protein
MAMVDGREKFFHGRRDVQYLLYIAYWRSHAGSIMDIFSWLEGH